MSDDQDFLSEDEATRLWHRAARLQADAARRAEARASAEGREEEATEPLSSEGYALTHVRAAALEAGIGAEFVDAALADLRAERALPSASNSQGRQLARRILGNPENAVTANRVIDATATDVLAAMEKIFPHEPYSLSLRDREGDPAAGGVLIFDIQGVGFSQAGQVGFKGDASWADLRQVYATLRPIDGGESCELTVRAPVAWAFSINAGFGAVFALMGGGMGFGIGSGLAAAAAALTTGLGAGLLAPILAAILVAGGMAGGGIGATAGYRVLYRHGMKKGKGALAGMLAAVAAEAQGGWGLDQALGEAPGMRALPEGDPPNT